MAQNQVSISLKESSSLKIIIPVYGMIDNTGLLKVFRWLAKFLNKILHHKIKMNRENALKMRMPTKEQILLKLEEDRKSRSG